jgi:hypothetical protein
MRFRLTADNWAGRHRLPGEPGCTKQLTNENKHTGTGRSLRAFTIQGTIMPSLYLTVTFTGRGSCQELCRPARRPFRLSRGLRSYGDLRSPRDYSQRLLQHRVWLLGCRLMMACGASRLSQNRVFATTVSNIQYTSRIARSVTAAMHRVSFLER